MSDYTQLCCHSELCWHKYSNTAVCLHQQPLSAMWIFNEQKECTGIIRLYAFTVFNTVLCSPVQCVLMYIAYTCTVCTLCAMQFVCAPSFIRCSSTPPVALQPWPSKDLLSVCVQCSDGSVKQSSHVFTLLLHTYSYTGGC
jgi:hypothetical protein